MKIITLVIELKIIKAATIPDILHLLGSEIEFLSGKSRGILTRVVWQPGRKTSTP